LKGRRPPDREGRRAVGRAAQLDSHAHQDSRTACDVWEARMTDPAADPLYVEFLRRGPGADFHSFCADHPAEAARLRELHEQHASALANLRAAGLTAIPPTERPSSSVLKSASTASSELLRRILAQGSKGARYQLRGEIARGGMGAVLRVWDEDIGRELAMKVVLGSEGGQVDPADPDLDGRRVSRFLEEAQITGQLDHPCVVPVHEIGIDAEARVYFTMRLVKGRHFGRILELVAQEEEGWSRTRALGVLLRVCEAMAYAHSKGVVHRDLKPSNVMVGNFGEVYVMDWGLARVIGRADQHDLRLRDPAVASGIRTVRRKDRSDSSDSPLVTMEGDVVGTPAYMPPEQARGRIEEVSARSDVYAIGAMLYHLIVGHMPYVVRGVTRTNVEVLDAVIQGPPQPLRELRSDVPAELEAICEKAMARDIANRYSDTLALAEDLRAYLEGRVVKAYQTGAVVELRKWVARNRSLAGAAAAAIVFLVAGLIGSLWQKSVADQNAAFAAEKAQEAERKGALAAANQVLAEQRAVEAADSRRRAEGVRDFLTDMLAQANPLESGERDIPVSRIVLEAARRLDTGVFSTDPGTELALRSTLGRAFQGIYRFEESERQYRIAKDLQSKAPTKDPHFAVGLDIELADAVAGRGRYAEAEPLVRDALAALEDQGLGSTPLGARALEVLANVRYNLGDSAGAVDCARRYVALRKEFDGPDSEATAIRRTRLAFHLVEANLLDEALVEVEHALRVLVSDTPRVRLGAATALRVRGNIHDSRGKYRDAVTDFEHALALREELFGGESTYVAEIASDLVTPLSRLGELDRAEAFARRALDLRRRLQGDHRDTATSLASLASILRMRKDLDGARALLEESLAMRERIFGAESLAVADTLRRLAEVEVAERDFTTAERLLLDSTAIWEKTLGPNRADLAENWVDLAKILPQMGRAAEARPLLEKAVALRVERLGRMHTLTRGARDQLATLLLDLCEWAAAETILRDALALYEESLPADSPLRTYTRAQLGAALAGMGRLDEAEPLLLNGWTAIGEDPKFWAVNKLFLLDHLVKLYTARGDEASVTKYREKAELVRKADGR